MTAQEADRLGRQLVLQARRWLPGRALVVVADSGFAALEPLAALSGDGVACITWPRPDAALYDLAPPLVPGTKGRPRLASERLATLAAVLADPATPWQRVTVPGWYGEFMPRAPKMAPLFQRSAFPTRSTTDTAIAADSGPKRNCMLRTWK